MLDLADCTARAGAESGPVINSRSSRLFAIGMNRQSRLSIATHSGRAPNRLWRADSARTDRGRAGRSAWRLVYAHGTPCDGLHGTSPRGAAAPKLRELCENGAPNRRSSRRVGVSPVGPGAGPCRGRRTAKLGGFHAARIAQRSISVLEAAAGPVFQLWRATFGVAARRPAAGSSTGV